MQKLTREQIKQLDEIFLKQLLENGIYNIEKILPEHKVLEDLEFDMLDLISITIEIESLFNITILDSDIDNCQTVNDIYELIDKLIVNNFTK